jgi:hypothetical protein
MNCIWCQGAEATKRAANVLQPFIHQASYVGLCNKCAIKDDEWYKYPADIAKGLLDWSNTERQAYFVLMLSYKTKDYFDAEKDFEDIVPALFLLRSNKAIVQRGNTGKIIADYAEPVLKQIGEKVHIDEFRIMLEAIEHKDPTIRKLGILRIRAADFKDGYNGLVRLLSDENESVQSEAQLALEGLTGKSFWIGKGDPKKWAKVVAKYIESRGWKD